ncbi:hypothetical protein FHS91_003965 [Sphingobium xanthum]|uniref:hypothetical protein n=1 Tax=Sphingobium xanthum TaxID=1387165 RepID=UPI001C8B130E|nr:hypothetical protein [Sphingobium xanthum]
MEAILALLLVASGAFAAWLLRRAWRAKPGAGAGDKFAGWAIIVASLVWPAFVMGPTLGPFVALAAISTGALGLVSSGVTFRKAKAARAGAGRDSLAPEPVERPTTAWRTTLRWLLAGPIGMIAAMAIGIAYSVWVPGEPQTRLVIGGLTVPVVWGSAMAWTLADSRILRATAVLVGTAIFGFGISILRGFA